MSVSGHKGQYGSSLHERQRGRRLGHPRTTDDLTKERGSSQDPQMVMRSLNRSESCTGTDTRNQGDRQGNLLPTKSRRRQRDD